MFFQKEAFYVEVTRVVLFVVQLRVAQRQFQLRPVGGGRFRNYLLRAFDVPALV